MVELPTADLVEKIENATALEVDWINAPDGADILLAAARTFGPAGELHARGD